MTIRQIVTATYDESANVSEQDYHEITAIDDYRLYGLSVNIQPASADSHILLIAVPLLHSEVTSGTGGVQTDAKIYFRTDGTTTQAAAGVAPASGYDGLTGSLYRHYVRAHHETVGQSVTFQDGSSGSGSEDPDVTHTDATSLGHIHEKSNGNDFGSDATQIVEHHHHRVSTSVAHQTLFYQRPTMFVQRVAGTTNMHRYDLAVSNRQANNKVRCYPKAGFATLTAIEIA